jgi:GT2 family glycosyltransferase
MISAEPSHQPAGAPLGRRPTASIIIPVHNKATITRHCLDNLLSEQDEQVEQINRVTREIIVVDDGSSDRTPELLAAYGDRIRVVRHEAARGFATACNAGAAAARGEFLVLLNNDTIPTPGWLTALVAHAQAHPRAAVVGSMLLFPNDTVQHAGVVFGLDREPHHIYAGFPARHPATTISRRYQAVTAACALFRRGPWEAQGGLDPAFHNGWEDVDFCLHAGEAGWEIHYCAESVLYHFESSSRDLLSEVERGNRALFASRWQEKIVPDDVGYYWQDGLFSASYGARYPIKLSVSPLLAGVTVGENERHADRLLYDRSRQVMILLRNNIILNVRVQDAEARAAAAEKQLAELLAPGNGGGASTASHAPESATTEHADAADPGDTVAPDPPPTAPPHRIAGRVESPGRQPDIVTDGFLIVAGWAMTEAGDATIEAIVNGESRGAIPYGEPRPDAVALYPGFPIGENCGFFGEVPVGDLPDGMHDVVVRISASDGAQAQLATTFEVDNHAFETGRVIGRLDLPVRGAMFIPRESMQISGWALAPSGIASIEAFVNGEERGRIEKGALRPDIAKRRRQYANADHCGFHGLVPLVGLPPGDHELLVRVTANDGRQLELPTRFQVDSDVRIDAGMPVINKHYGAWLERRMAGLHALDPESSAPEGALIEVIVPLEGDCEEELAALAASLQTQSYPNWQMTLVAAESCSAETRSLAKQLAQEDSRIVLQPARSADHIAAINAALGESGADWVGFISPGVILSPNAMGRVACSLAADPDADIVYTDDDRIDPESTERWNPFFKPDWSPDLLLAMSYFGPLTLFRRTLAVTAGGLRDDIFGAEVSDLVLRLTEQTDRVRHLPEVLITTIERAPALDDVWHPAGWRESERRVREDALARRGIAGSVEPGLHPGSWRVRYTIADPPGVTALIPTGGKMHLLRPCLIDLLERTDYPNLEILLVDNSGGDEVAHLVEEFAPRYPNVRRVVDNRKPFNYPALINDAIPSITTPYVLMLNDDITVIDPGWLSAMVEQGQRPKVGIVGAKLLYPDDTIQHAGVILGPFGGSVHVYKRLPAANPGYFDLPDVVRNCSAVTFACALIDRSVFDTIGGLDAENLPVAFNDVDFCLRAREIGYEVIYTPHAALYHHESVTKTVIAHPHEIGFLRTRWRHVIDHDPYYNPNLTRDAEDARLNMEKPSAA